MGLFNTITDYIYISTCYFYQFTLNMSSIVEPRLSVRLLHRNNLNYQDLQSYNVQRNRLMEVERQRRSMSFDLNQFVTDNMSLYQSQLVTQCYKEFLEDINDTIVSAAPASNNARVLFSSITQNNADKDFSTAYSAAVSYFGNISRLKFRKIAESAKRLQAASHAANFDLIRPAFLSEVNLCRPCLLPNMLRLIETAKISDLSANKGVPLINAQWLLDQCSAYLQSSSAAFFNCSQLAIEVIKACRATSSSAAELQAQLFDLLGEGGLDLMSQLVEHRRCIEAINESDCLGGRSTQQGRDSSASNVVRSSVTTSSSSSVDAPSRDWLQDLGFGDDYLLQERALGLQKGALGGHGRELSDDWYEGLAPAGTTQFHEKRGLPAGAERKTAPGYEEVTIPATKRRDANGQAELVTIDSIEEPWARLAFAGTARLNTIQSRVFACAYKSSENMLICAPTGAGKTNIAMLTFLQLVRQLSRADGSIDRDAIKAVYIAPMKALAQEVVAKFSARLQPLGLVVREYTGDMQLTKQEVAESHLLVCTPEKYDVVTRKGGEGSLGTLVSLIIIDEVHLLADDRGAVIETIVARTQRFVETSQKFIRIVGLSATLPNYQDVAAFLRVNHSSGLFYFGPEYRPIPLDQSFIGVTEKQRIKRNDQMNRHAFDKLVDALERGKQVMIFVHARKDTSRTAEAMADLSGKHGAAHLFENVHHEHYSLWKRQVDKSRSVEVQQLFAKGIGVHHAGMLRADRSLTEQLFECGLLKLLCCTSTLAWGVNLPAHTVIIKGTELYDPERGGFVDLSILDVLQIFGRAGRPQYDTSGHAILITSHKSLNPYLGLLTQQAPIESALVKSLADHLNAEIVNGTVSNLKEAASWLSYTFLFVRMCKNPVAYGMKYDEVFADPRLEGKRAQLVQDAAELLDSCMMVRLDRRSGNLGVTDLGRIASHYYIKHGTIEAFNNMLTPHLSDPDALHVLCSSAEFDQLKVRPEELVELDGLKKQMRIATKSSVDDTAGKVNVLLLGYMNHSRINSFTLQSDTNYVALNTGRIARALFEICLRRGWSTMAGHYLALCKAIDRRMRLDQSPLRQFGDELPHEVLKRLEEAECSPDRLADLDAREVGQLVHNMKLGAKVLALARQLPRLQVDAAIQPITRGILKLSLTVSAAFEWNDRYHGHAQSFWIWVEDGENEYIYHSEQFVLLRRQRDEARFIEFTIPVREPLPPQYYIRCVSDSWVGCESVAALSFKDLILPTLVAAQTDLLDVHPVPRGALGNPQFESLYKFSHFNPVQSQAFNALYHSNLNILIGAPTGSGKTVMGELAILRLRKERPGAKTIYIAPLKALARERLMDWKRKLGQGLGLVVLELTGDITPDAEDLRRADVLIVTPEKWDSISRGWQKREYVRRVELVVIDEIHLLGVDRGPVLEVIVSRMRFIATQTASPIRFVGLSTALANPRDLGDWLGIGDVGVYNFRPSVRPVPMTIHIQGFPGKHYCPRMATMNKPAYAAILEHSPEKPALIFVSSRRQTRLTALDLISYCAADDDPKQFLHMPEDEVLAIASTLRDRALRDTIVFGIAIHHAGLDNHDRSVVEELFFAGKVQVLVCTSTLAWGVNLPCHLVIVKGTEFFDAKQSRYVDFPVTDVLQMMGRAGRPQFDETGVACVLVHEPKKTFYRKFLHEPFPVESSLHLQLHEHFNAEIAAGAITGVRDCVEYLTWTFYFRRLVANPSYYGLSDASPARIQAHLTTLSSGVAADLLRADCITVSDEGDFGSTVLGGIASHYYLHYRTAGMLRRRFAALVAEPPSLYGSAEHVDKLMKILCDAQEFAELPVRHNEEHLNAELALSLPEPLGSGWPMESPHTKAFLLLQAHIHRLCLPISDYVNDTKTVLDQVPRVLNAMVDVAASMRLLGVVAGLARMSQIIIQGVALNRSELLQLPGVSAEAIAKCGDTRTLRDAVELMAAGRDDLTRWVPQAERASHLCVLKGVSTFKLEAVVSADADPSSGDRAVEISITRLTGAYSGAIHAPRYHKPKAASWWCMLALVSCPVDSSMSFDGDLICVRKIGSVGVRTICSMPVSASALTGCEGSRALVVYLLSDSQIGVDEIVSVAMTV